jgi:hypothetical protein
MGCTFAAHFPERQGQGQQRDAGIGFGAVEFGYQTLGKLAQHVESSAAT